MERFKEFVGPDDLAMMQRVLDAYCADRRIDATSTERYNTATLLFALFKRGITT